MNVSRALAIFRRPSFFAQLALVGALTVSIAGNAPAQQKSEPTRDQSALAEDQALLQRQLQRLRQTMEVLAGRFEAEGRTHAAKLLRDGLAHIDQRAAEQGAKTLEELMRGSHTNIQSGKPVQAIETQQAIIQGLERLYAILTDRQGLDDLDKSLAELRAIQQNLSQLADREAELTKATSRLQEEAKSSEQKELESAIAKALEEQRALLARNERAARESSVFQMEALERALDQLIERQTTDARVLAAWKPEERPALDEATAPIDRAAERSARAERLAQAAAELARAARDLRVAESDPTEIVRDLERAQAREARHERAAGDPAASRAAESLKSASEAVRKSPTDATARAATAEGLEKEAADLARAAAEEEAAAQEAQRAALEALKKLGDPSTTAGQTAESVRAALKDSAQAMPAAAAETPAASPAITPEERAKHVAETRRASDEAQHALHSGLDDLHMLKAALSTAQKAASEQAEQLKRSLATLPQGATPAGEEASAKLDAAAKAQKSAAEQAGNDQAAESAQSAAQAERALREARAALAEARKAAAKSAPSGSQSESSAIQAAQRELARKAEELADKATQSDLDPRAKEETRAALDEAKRAMEKASESLSEGASSSAAQSQSQAAQSLQKAAQAAQKKGTSARPEQQKNAEELAAVQEKIRKELQELAQRNKKRDAAAPLPSLDKAQDSAQSASQSLSDGDLDDAAQQEEQTEREIRQAQKELGEEEEQYQKLRQEELLFKITEEVKSLIDEHQAQMRATVEVDAPRKPGEAATHTQRLRLRKIAKAEEALGARAAKIGTAILAEESVVFAEVLTQASRDLERLGRDMGEVGEYQSGERVQAIQQDVEQSLGWLFEALQSEKERRQQEQKKSQPPKGGKNSPAPDDRLVPDVAELKLLRRLEVEILDGIDKMKIVNPELTSGGAIDPLVLEDLGRLANRHQRTSDLFQRFRERLHLPPPEAERE